MPTSSGKMLLYVVPTLLQRTEVIVVVIPLITLRYDLRYRYTYITIVGFTK